MALHRRFVDEIHARLLVRYGSKWLGMWTGVPEEAVSENRFWPLGSKPAGLMKLASSSTPSGAGAVVPGSLARTMPSHEMVMLVVSAGSQVFASLALALACRRPLSRQASEAERWAQKRHVLQC